MSDNTLKLNTNNALIRHAFTGALCSTCCVSMDFTYIVLNGIVIPMTGPSHNGVSVQRTLWYGFYWMLDRGWGGPYGDDQWIYQVWLNRSKTTDYDGEWYGDAYQRFVPMIDGMPVPSTPPIIWDYNFFIPPDLGGASFEAKSGKLIVDWDAGTAQEA